jgi:hypothetical protein
MWKLTLILVALTAALYMIEATPKIGGSKHHQRVLNQLDEQRRRRRQREAQMAHQPAGPRVGGSTSHTPTSTTENGENEDPLKSQPRDTESQIEERPAGILGFPAENELAPSTGKEAPTPLVSNDDSSLTPPDVTGNATSTTSVASSDSAASASKLDKTEATSTTFQEPTNRPEVNGNSPESSVNAKPSADSNSATFATTNSFVLSMLAVGLIYIAV